MNVQDQIDGYIESQAEPKRSEMRSLHHSILRQMPNCQLYYLDGKDETGKTVSNPNIGYGSQKLVYADGSTRDFYQIGLSANTAGLSLFIMGLKDRDYLPATYGKTIGKASVTSYCIKFKKTSDINESVLLAAIRDGVAKTSATNLPKHA